MILSTQDRLRAMQRSLENVIIPAIPENAGQAREQAQFAAMHCKAMLAQVDWEYAMETTEAEHFAGLCAALFETAPPDKQRECTNELNMLAARCDRFLSGSPASFGDVRATVLALRSLADSLLASTLGSGNAAMAKRAADAVLAAARRHDIRTRAWVQESSYEAGDVPACAIGDSLDADTVDALLEKAAEVTA
jgi:hypothetical protein